METLGTKRGKNERGQVAVLFALIFTFMLVLFAMVIDIAHLINNKINLQLAADSAAYAGAAWQARVLNRIAAINYHMRQDVKELAMRLEVTHLRHNRNYESVRGADVINGAPGVANVDAFICQQAHGYLSESGVRYADDTNLCRNASAATGGLPPIVVPPVIAAFDPFEAAIAAQIRRIADAADQQCAAAAHDNQDLAQHLANAYTARSQFHLAQAAALANFLNSIPAGRVLQPNEQNPIAQVAYQAAFKNLTPANHNNFKLEILSPAVVNVSSGQATDVQGQGQTRFIALEKQTMSASILYVNFNVVGDGCVGQPGFFDFNDMVAGVSKVRDVVTYFAVKASAVPDLVFLPQRWFDTNYPLIEAYSAAKPFGSRIGPEAGIDSLLPVSGRPGNQSRIVNFSFFPGDTLGMMNRKMMALFDAFHPVNSQSRPEGNQNRGWPDFGPQNAGGLGLALQAIHAPTVFDALFYSVFPDPSASNDYFDPQFASALYPDYLEAYNGNGGVDQSTQPGTATPYLASFLGGDGNRGPGWIRIDATPSGAGPGPYSGYAEEKPQSHQVTTGIGLPFITDSSARDLGFANRTLVHSGWTPIGGTRHPRIGYSVKFVGLDALLGKLQVNTAGKGQVPIANRPQRASTDADDFNLTHTIH